MGVLGRWKTFGRFVCHRECVGVSIVWKVVWKRATGRTMSVEVKTSDTRMRAFNVGPLASP